MELVEYVINDLLQPPGYRSVRFVPAEQCKIFKHALEKLILNENMVFWTNVNQVGSELILFHEISRSISAPNIIDNWEILSEELNELDWLEVIPKNFFFYMSGALQFWKCHPMIAGLLVNTFQPISSSWTRRNVRMILIFAME